MFLAGDVGGTKIVLAWVNERGETVREETVASHAYDSLAACVTALSVEAPSDGDTGQPSRACFAVAGPVRDGRSHLPNLGWDIVASEFPFETRLLNDLQATSMAIPVLSADELETLQTGEPESNGTIGVVAPGTGLGFGLLVRDERGIRAVASEGGHATFAPVDERQRKYYAFLEEKFDHVSRERACSGGALPLMEEFLGGEDPKPFFVEMLASIVGDWAVETAATGGIYLGGGMPPRVLPLLQAPGFLARYRDKGRFDEFLDRVPVQVILEPKAALRGAVQTVLASG